MALVFDADSVFYAVRIEGSFFTDGYALVTGGAEPVTEDLDSVASSILQAYKTAFGPITWDGATIHSCRVYTETGYGEDIAPSAGGATVNDPMATNSALLLHKGTSVRGRRARGRAYIPAVLRESLVNSAGELDSLFLADAGSAAQDWLTFADTGQRPQRIPQSETRPRKDGTPGTPPILPWPVVTSIFPDPVIATQRRRLRR